MPDVRRIGVRMRRRDCTGREVKPGDTIAFATDYGMVLAAVVRFTPRRVMVRKIGWTIIVQGSATKDVVESSDMYIQNVDKAFILPYSPDHLQALTITNRAKWMLGKPCEHCEKGKLELCNSEAGLPVGVACLECGAMFDLAVRPRVGQMPLPDLIPEGE